MDSPRSDHTSPLTRRTPSTPGRGGTPIGGKWESEAVGELQAVRTQQQWKRRPVLAWAIAFAVLALLALRTSWPSVMPPEEPQEMLWFAGGVTVAVTSLWLAFGLLRRYMRATPLPTDLTARQRVLLGLPPVADTPDKTTPRRPPAARVEPSGAALSSPPPPPRYRSSYASPPPASPMREREQLHRTVLTRRMGPFSPEVITDQRALDRYLARSPSAATGEEHTTEGGYLTSPLGGVGPGAEVRAYRVSPRSSPAKGRTGDEFGYFNTQAAQELVERLGVEGSMEEWTERTRQWLVEQIVWPLVRDIQEVTKAGLPLTKPLTQAVSTQAAAASSAPTSMWYSFQSAPQPTTTSFSQNPVVQKRQMLEKYMDVHGSPSREYIVQRVKELAEGGCMAAFRWNGGGSWQGKPWTTELPTDSQILIHLFCAHMDGLLPADPRADKNKPFSSLYYVLAPKSPDAVPTAAKIYQSHVHPPHFKVLEHQEVWDTFQGRNNLFHAIFLWVFAVQTRLDGFIGQVHLSETGLDRVIRTNA